MANRKHKRRPREKPSRPYPLFPLTEHNNGQWCKKIRGKIHFFGVWADPEAALANYHHVAADLHAGHQPQAINLPEGAVTVKTISNWSRKNYVWPTCSRWNDSSFD